MIELTNDISAVFEAQHQNEYQLKFLGNQSEAAARSYRLTSFLNRYHNVHLDQTTEQPLTIYLQSGATEKPDGQVLFNKDGVIIVKQ